MKKIDSAQMGAQAREIFESGYNCAQAVAMAYADVVGVSSELLATVTSSFGGGFARQREVCGAVSGMGVVVGFCLPSTDPKDKERKMANYALVSGAVDSYREANGSIICRELLALSRGGEQVSRPKRSCAELVEMAATMIGDEINKKCLKIGK